MRFITAKDLEKTCSMLMKSNLADAPILIADEENENTYKSIVDIFKLASSVDELKNGHPKNYVDMAAVFQTATAKIEQAKGGD